ncbi:MAG: efflux RND transporter periplasmic adaptor subunit [Phycisphaeraceae bacterium]|nr:MAG: efflux RND transporter periplasmic adaptor subunit [Phycisphaeraceae bacterium]
MRGFSIDDPRARARGAAAGVARRARIRGVRGIVLALGACIASLASAQPAANVRVAEAKSERLMVPREVTGEIVSLRRSLLASQIEGFVVELGLNPGDGVERGSVVARLDDTLARLDVDQAQADLLAARGVVDQREAELVRYQRDLERVQALSERGSTTASELDSAEADVRTTEALLAQANAKKLSAEALLDRAKKRLADKTITAPFAGRVVQKKTEVGEWVAPGDTIVEIVSLSDMEARIDVPEHLVSYLNEDVGTISLRIPGLGPGVEIDSTLLGVIPQADTLSRMFPVRLAVQNGSHGLKPGMSLTAFVPTGAHEPVLTVPKDALLRDDAGEYLYMAVPFHSDANPAVTAQAVPARVERRFAAGDRVAIRPGQVKPGSMVLVEGNERVFPTQPLVVQDPPPGSPFAPSAQPAGDEADDGKSGGDQSGGRD